MKKEKEATQDRTIEVSDYMPFFESCVPSFLELEDVKGIFPNEIVTFFLDFVWYVSLVFPKFHPTLPDSHSLLWPAQVR